MLCHFLSRGRVNLAIKVTNKLRLPGEIIQRVVEAGLTEFFSKNYESLIDTALEIKEEYHLPEEIFQQVVKQELISRLHNNSIDYALEINNKFPNIISSQEIINKIPELQNLLNQIQTISPEFYDQALKSSDIVICLCGFKDNPNQLLQEIRENPSSMLWDGKNNIYNKYLMLKDYSDYFYLSMNEKRSFPEQMVINRPDIIFLTARSAIPWGIMYKEWAKSLKNKLKRYGREDLVSKIPLPQFKLADAKRRGETKEEWDIIKERAINRYMKKLETVKDKDQRQNIKEPIKIAVFDEAVNMGFTLNYQEKGILQAIKKLGINAEVIRFSYLSTSKPSIGLPMNFIDEDSIARRTPSSIDNAEHLREIENYKMLQEVGRYSAGGGGWIRNKWLHDDRGDEQKWIEAWINLLLENIENSS